MVPSIRSLVALAAINCLMISSALAALLPNPGIPATSPDFVAWATGVEQFSPAPQGGMAGDESRALGVANAGVVSLGELDAAAIAAGKAPGSITLSFDTGIANGAGWDFAVFENAWDFPSAPFRFAELAYVEVSSNGTDFSRFPSLSLNTESTGDSDTDIYTGSGRGYATLNVNNLHNLAGSHPSRVGTAFDLTELMADPAVMSGMVDLTNIGYVRIVDIPGDGSFLDSQGHPILDAWATLGTGGNDLDAVGVRHTTVPEPSTIALALLASAGLFVGRQRS